MPPEKLIIKSLEADSALIEYGNITFSLPRKLLPRAAKEGSIIKMAVVLDTGSPKKQDQGF